MNNKNDIKPFGIKRNLDYLKENFVIMWRITIEYKVNLFFALLQMVIYMVIHITGLYLVYYSVGDVIGWKFEDFLLFYFLCFLVTVIAGLFTWGKELDEILLRGDMNTYLTRPLNSFIMYVFSSLSGWAVLSFFVRGILFTLALIYFNVKIDNLVLIIFFIFFINLIFFAIIQFILSLEFKFKKISKIIFDIYDSANMITSQYPAPFLKSFEFVKVLFILPSFIVGYLMIPILRLEKNIFDLKYDLVILMFLTIIFLGLTFFNWHYGLKKYEAFG